MIRIGKDGDRRVREVFTPREVDLLIDGSGVEPELCQGSEVGYISNIHTNRPTRKGKGTTDAVHNGEGVGSVDGHCGQDIVAGGRCGSIAVTAIEFGEAPDSGRRYVTL